jgi:hypothetical protein
MPQGNVEISGDFHLSGQQTEVVYNAQALPISSTVKDVPVTLAVGYDKFGLPLSFSALGGTTTTKSRLTVTGNVEVEGDLIGSGQIFVKKDNSGQGGHIQVNGNSFLSATRTDGMALVAESVSFGEVDANTSTQLFAMMPNDFDLYKEAMFPQSDYSASIQDTFESWQGAPGAKLQEAVGSFDRPANPGTLRAAPLGVDYTQVLDGMLPGGQTPGGKDVNTLLVAIDYPDVNGAFQPTAFTARELIDRFVSESGGMTLGLHTRLREFIKSLDRVNPNSEMINLWNPAAFASQDPTIQTLVANQVSAYNQDARSRGKTLLDYVQNTPNPYQEQQRRDFLFGGILYAKGNIYTNLASSFNLLGAMISEVGTVGFDDLNSGKIIYDPTSFEDQFDISKLGLGPAFFWIGP